ncbi:MAG: choline ABC transporter ATP-binding protein, partial [Acetobacteraceae bacterium]
MNGSTPAEGQAIEFRDVDILFSGGSGRGRAAALAAATALLDRGRTRAEIAKETGVVLGVAGASLKVAPGEICVLMGLSGSGKSTLLRAANGLNRVTRGQVLVRHGSEVIDVASCDAATLRRMRTERIAMVFQQFALLPWRTVRENVGFGLEIRGMAPAERNRIVEEKLRLVGLEQWANRYANELSGGMQQRVGLARAFATDADILLMDEPFSALDPLIRTKLQDELLALQQTVQKTILFVSHDLDEALKIGNQIAIMEGGRIVQAGSPEDIVLRPADAYVAEFVQHMNPLSVLRASAVMRPLSELAREGDWLWLDSAGTYRLALDGSGAARAATRDDCPLPISAATEAIGTGLALVAGEMVLKSVIDLHA